MVMKRATIDRMMESWESGYDAGVAEGLRRAGFMDKNRRDAHSEELKRIEALSKNEPETPE